MPIWPVQSAKTILSPLRGQAMLLQFAWAQNFGLRAKPFLAWEFGLANAFLFRLLAIAQWHPLARFLAPWMI